MDSLSIVAYRWRGNTPLSLASQNDVGATGDGTHTYTWNARNQLASISGAVSASFAYDPFGRRVSKTIGAATTNYLYDGVNPVQELAGSMPAANLLTGGIDEYFTRTDASGSANFLTDALGSTIALTGAGGTTLAQYTYDPYGNMTMTGNSANPYQYTGRENDSTGLYYYRARYYHPQLQRFVSEDPIGLIGGINRYAYVMNSPVIATDPTGMTNSFEHILDSLQAWLSSNMRGGMNALARDPLFPLSDVLTDRWQGATADQTNLHAMAGRKPNGNMQTCREALAGAAQDIADFMNAGKVGTALHVAEDWATPSHGGQPWFGGLPNNAHLKGDWWDWSVQNSSNRVHNGRWIMNNLPEAGQTITPAMVMENMRGGNSHCN